MLVRCWATLNSSRMVRNPCFIVSPYPESNMEEESFGAEQADNSSARTLNGGQSSGDLEGSQGTFQEERPYKCNLCEKSYRHAGSLVNHKKTHQIGQYMCLVCHKEFSNPMGLKSHLRTHSEEKRFKCEQCGEAFRMSQQLYNHRRSSHGFYPAEKPQRSHEVSVPPPAQEENGNLMSNLEKYIAESMVPADFSHLVTKYYHEGTSLQGQVVAKDNRENPRGTDEPSRGEPSSNDGTDNTEEYRFKCNQCEKAYKHAGSLANHKQTHVVGVYQCAICFKEFSNLMAMKNHCRLHSESRARQRCRSPRSPRSSLRPSFGSPDTLQSDPLHSTDFIEECEDPTAVSQVSGNQDYVENHDHLPPHISPKQEDLQAESVLQCTSQDNAVQVVETSAAGLALPMSYPASDQEQQYNGTLEEAKLGDLEDRPFKCQECGKSYRHAGSLINHKKTHQTGVYSCSLCSKQLFNAAALKSHFRAHFKSRPGRRFDDDYFHSASFSEFFHNPGDTFQCAICGDFFTQESDFLQHQEIHKEEASQETFTDTQNLEEVPVSWPESSQVSQVNSDYSYYNAPSMLNIVKAEKEDLADQPTPYPSAHEHSLVSPSKTKEENAYPDCQDLPNDFSQLGHDQTASPIEETSSGLGEHDSPIDRPYCCETCGKTYRHKSSLINHNLTHKTGIYQCSLCPKQYSNLMALRNHLRFHGRSYAGRRGIFSRRATPFSRGRPRLTQNKTALSSEGSVKLKDVSLQNNANGSSPEEGLAQQSCGDFYDHKETLKSHSLVCKTSVPGSSNLYVALKQEEPLISEPKDVWTAPETGEHQEDPSEASEPQSQRLYECDLCDKSYRHSGSLINHKRTHQTGDYMCPYCSRHVHNMAALKNHIRIHHKFKKGDEDNHSRFYYSDQNLSHGDNGNLFGCPRCDEIFNNEDDLVAHQMVHMELDGDPSGKGVQRSSGPNNDLSMETTVGCEWGHSSNPDGSKMLDKDVKSSEHGVNPTDYTCVECGEVYNSVGDLNNHKLTHQVGIYQCSFCPKEYPSLSALRSHFESHMKPQLLRNPGKERTDGSEGKEGRAFRPDSNYTCGHCGLAFSNEVEFYQHQALHEKRVTTESLPIPHVRGKEPELTFSMDSSEQALLKSIKSELEETVHPTSDGTSQLSHICGFCGKTYDDLGSLQAHSLTHGPIETPPSTNENLNVRGNFPDNAVEQTLDEENIGDTATNEESSDRPFTCEQCGKSYRHSGSLVNHRKTHLVGNFQCLACFRQYPNMAAYTTHLRHYLDCKQHLSMSNLPELQTSNLQSSLHPIGDWKNLPPAIPLPEQMATSVLPSTFKPCIDTLSLDRSCLAYPNTPTNSQIQVNHAKRSRRRFLRKNKRNAFRSTPVKDDPSINLKDPALRISKYSEKKCQTEELGPIPRRVEDCKVENPNPNEVGTGVGQRPFRCEVCGRSYMHAGSLINHKQTHKTGIFRCSICQKRFFNLMAMKNHNRIHFEMKRHTCPDCGKAFRLRKQLETHQRIHWKKAFVRKFGKRNRRGTRLRRFSQVQKKSTSLSDSHSNEQVVVGQDAAGGEKSLRSSLKRDPASRPFQCQECGRSYRHAGSLCNHKKSHRTGQYSCSVCHRMYSNLMAMKNHERIHYDAKRHHCSECGKTFKWKRQLTKHKLLHAAAQSDDLSVLDLKEGSVRDNRRGKRSGRCGKRPRRTKSSSDSHSSSTTEVACTTCGVLFSSSHALETHTCSQSGIQIPDPVASVVAPKDEDERPFRCELCGRTYRHAGSLVNHKKTHKKGLYECSLCSKQFFNSLAIKNHLSTHKAKKNFRCGECGKAFRSSRQLVCHGRKHANVGLLRCTKCNCEFTSEVTLKRHQRIHKEVETSPSSSQKETDVLDFNLESEPSHGTPSTQEVRKYKCDQCDRSYLHAGSLFNHQKTHTIGVYKCPDCSKEYFNLLAFKNHLRIHKFSCEDCGKAFRIAGHLEAHRKTHKQEKGSLTALQIGKKRFRSPSSFEPHQMTHNGPDSDLELQPLSNIWVDVT